jgi:hypothetical protein
LKHVGLAINSQELAPPSPVIRNAGIGWKLCGTNLRPIAAMIFEIRKQGFGDEPCPESPRSNRGDGGCVQGRPNCPLGLGRTGRSRVAK